VAHFLLRRGAIVELTKNGLSLWKVLGLRIDLQTSGVNWRPCCVGLTRHCPTKTGCMPLRPSQADLRCPNSDVCPRPIYPALDSWGVSQS
jgi:hypothetical protein